MAAATFDVGTLAEKLEGVSVYGSYTEQRSKARPRASLGPPSVPFRRSILMRVLPLPAAALLFCTACATTTFTSTWKAPDAGPVDYAGKKIAAVFLTSEESTRRVAEDALAREFSAHGSVGVASYTLLSSAELKDQARSRAELLDAGCTGSVVMRITGEKERIRSTGYSTVHYAPYPAYSHWDSGVAYQSDSFTTDTIVSVETLVYDLEQDKLLWGGKSETFEPSEIDEFVVDLATAAAEEMRAAGLLR